MTAGVVSFSLRLRNRRRLLAALCGFALVGGVLGALLLQVLYLDDGIVDRAAWDGLAPFAQVRQHTGLPVMLQVWLTALAWPAAVAMVLVAFEAAVYLLRIDRGDDSWTSIAWSLGSWRWIVFAAVPVAAIAMFDFSVAIVAVAAMQVALLAMPFFALNVENLRGPRVPARWRWFWPGWQAIAAWVAMWALFYLLNLAIEWLGVPDSAHLAVMPVQVVALVAASACVDMLWLHRSRIGLRAAAARACRPRVVVPMVLQYVRWLVLFLLVLAPVVALGSVLVLVIPQFETALLGAPASALSGAWLWTIRATRFLVAWWWAGQLILVGIAYLVLDWFDSIATARLLVQLGVADDAAPSIASDRPG